VVYECSLDNDGTLVERLRGIEGETSSGRFSGQLGDIVESVRGFLARGCVARFFSFSFSFSSVDPAVWQGHFHRAEYAPAQLPSGVGRRRVVR
jgi:hypothetical protein